MTKHKISLSIKTPCTENWEKMSASENGKFCNKCQKNVIDFTGMTDAAITTIIHQSDAPICGKLRADQMNRHLTPSYSYPRESNMLYPSILMALLALQTIQPGNAQNHIAPKARHTTETIVQNDTNKVKIHYQVSGVVMDHISNEFLPFVNVYIVELEIGTTTDLEGKFSLTIPDSLKRKEYTLALDLVGYVSQRIIFKHEDLPLATKSLLNMERQNFLGLLIIDEVETRKEKRAATRARKKEKKRKK